VNKETERKRERREGGRGGRRWRGEGGGEREGEGERKSSLGWNGPLVVPLGWGIYII
jgi:hypothetical protein